MMSRRKAAISTPSSQVDSSFDQPAANASYQPNNSSISQPIPLPTTPLELQLHWLTLRFHDSVLERKYAAQAFVGAYTTTLLACITLCLLFAIWTLTFLSTRNTTFISSVNIGIIILCGAMRTRLHHMKDQYQAMCLFSHGCLLLTVLGAALLIQRSSARPLVSMGVTTQSTLFFTSVWAVLMTHQRVCGGMCIEYVILMSFTCIVCFYFSPVATLQDQLIYGSGMLVGNLLGHTIESIRRQHFQMQLLLSEGHSKQLCAQEQLMAYLFHELRNDQSAILGMVEILSKKPEPDPMLLDINLHAGHAAQIVTNMLDWTKLRAGRLQKLPAMPFSIAAVCRDALQLSRHLIRDKPVEMVMCGVDEWWSGTHVGGASCEPKLLGSAIHVTQSLVILLTNACKYTDVGTVQLSVSARFPKEAPQDGMQIEFTVADTGCGIPAEQRIAIFEMYMHGPRIGSGIGLPLCRQLAALMGGSLELIEDSEADRRGATFVLTIELPVHQVPSGTIAPAEDESPSTACLSTQDAAIDTHIDIPPGLHVLVADDLRPNRMFLILMLQSILPDAIYTEVETGEAALEHISSSRFDLVFLDENYGHNKLTGLEVTKLVRELEQDDPSRKCVPIVGCTGDEGTEHTESALQVGQSLIWGKPMPPRELMEMDIKHMLQLFAKSNTR